MVQPLGSGRDPRDLPHSAFVGQRDEESQGRTMRFPPALLLLSLSGCLSIQGPKVVMSLERQSVTLQCVYESRWDTYRKWWCRGADWDSCEILVQTSGSEQEVKRGRVSIRDNQSRHLFSVTMENLRREDTNTYWCGIQKTGTDLGFKVKVTVGSAGEDPMNLTGSSSAGPADSSGTGVSPFIRTHYVLLVFVKVPILLVLLGVILWLKESQRVPKKQQGQPLYANLPSDLRRKGVAL